MDDITKRLRTSNPSVLPRIREGAILFDLRTIGESEFGELVAAVAATKP